MMRPLSSRKLLFTRLALCSTLLLGGAASNALFAQTATVTSLTATPTSPGAGTALVLTATVAASGNPVTPGLVLFCDTAAGPCQGSALLGTAQLVTGGTATLRLMPGIGSHSIKAVFTGTAAFIASASAAQSITVTGASPTSASISFTGATGSYTLSSTVSYQGLVTPGTAEDILFTDTSNHSLALGSAPLGTISPPVYGFTTIASSPFASGNIPSAIVSTDFNGDGIPDIAVANYSDNTVTLYMGDGSGGYTATGSPITVGSGPSALAVADFNSDGHTDLAVVDALAGTVTILLGDGTGALHLAAPVSTQGSGPQSIVIADFNSDGVPDLAVTNQLSSTITVLLGDGAGGFIPTSASPITVGGNPSSIAVLDFNVDGHTDLAIANTYDGTITILLGDGTGTFAPSPASPIIVPAGPSSIAAADFDGDGRTDLAIASASGDTLSILLNKIGGAVLVSGPAIATGSSPSALTIGDFNGDGKQDIAVSNANSSDVALFLGDGSGNFTPAAQSPLGNFNAPSALALADIDSDGRQDLLVTNVGTNSVSLRPQRVTQTASASLPALSVFGGGNHLVTATYPGDTSYAASISTFVSLTGSTIPTVASLSFSPSASVAYRATAQLTAGITPVAAHDYTSTGTIAFTADTSTSLGTGNLTNGQAVVSVNSLPVGPHAISAAYSGDINFGPSATAGTLIIVQAGTVTRLTASSDSATPGASITFTATVASVTSGFPTGVIKFLDGTDASVLGTATLSSGGTAVLSVATLAPGTHTVSAAYQGDVNYTASTSSPISESIADFSLTSVNPVQIVTPAAAATFTIRTTPVGTFSSPIAFTVSGLPSGASASFQPPTVTPGASAVSSTLTVLTTRQTVAQFHPSAWTAFALLLLPWFSRRLRRENLVRPMLFSLLACSILAGLNGCGRGTGYFTQASKTYNLVVTATSGTLHHTTRLTLTIE